VSKRKKDEVDLLEGFDFDAAFSGEIKGPEAFVPERSKEVAPKLDQSSIKVAPEPAPKLDQSSTKRKVALHQSSIKVASEPAPNHASKLDQSSIKVASILSFDALAGLQRNSLLFIYESCRLFGSKISQPIQIKNLAESIKTTVAAARVAVQRIEEKGFIARFEYKDGRGGWTKYELPNEVYSQLFFRESSIKVASNLDQSSIKVAPEPAPEPAPRSSSSSRVFNLKNSTTTSVLDISAIDVSSVFQHGITTSVLSRCIELYPDLALDQLEVLVARFAEFIKDPKNRVQNARGFFISLAEQASKGQVPLDHINTPNELLMREFVLLQEQAKQQRDELYQKAQEFEFELWAENLSNDEKLSLVPENSILKLGTAPYSAMLKRHFAEHVWPEKKAEILKSAAKNQDSPLNL
jgi:hypothetical protein